MVGKASYFLEFIVRCRLCGCEQNVEVFSASRRSFFICIECGYTQVLREFLPPKESEQYRYLQHKNSLNNPRYMDHLEELNRSFLSLIDRGKIGLDFGCGPTKAMEELWRRRGNEMHSYDPYFFPEDGLLKNSYGFVICCEAVEHFHDPQKEFFLLDQLLDRGGVLAIKTSFYLESRNFENWNYQRDFTHVGFFSHKSFTWISQKYDWEIKMLEDPIAIFQKR
jgi:hypothetical protein